MRLSHFNKEANFLFFKEEKKRYFFRASRNDCDIYPREIESAREREQIINYYRERERECVQRK